MNFRAYLNGIVITLCFLGVLSYQQDAVVPNQEIVLEFSNVSVSDTDTQHAVELITRQLASAGVDVDAIRVEQLADGQLTISYYSESDIASIKDVLSKEQALALGINADDEQPLSELPSEDQKSYNLQVFEIQQGNDFSTGLAGKLALEQAKEASRFVNPTSYAPQTYDIAIVSRTVAVAHKFQNTEALTIEAACYIIPEVRAGPGTSFWNA